MNEAGDSINNYTIDTLYNGIFTFRNLPVGTYKLSFRAENHIPVDTTIVVTAATESAMKVLMFNPDLPLYKEIPPDYPSPVQDAGVIPMNSYNFALLKEANPDWLNGASIRKVVFKNEKLYVLTEEPKIHIVNAANF